MSKTTNLYIETELRMRNVHKKWSDIESITLSHEKVLFTGDYVDYKIPVNKFKECAKRFNYDSGYGSTEVNETLRINFNDGTWFERWEYDGSEGWAYKKPVDSSKCILPPKNIPIDELISSRY